MFQSKILVSSPDLPLPLSDLRRPFAVLLDTRDAEWIDSNFLTRKAIDLLNAGCRYYVCFGPNAELAHDQIDDSICELNNESNVTTTYHVDEESQDVVNFFKNIAMKEMATGLLLVNNTKEWLSMAWMGGSHGGEN